MRSDKRLNLTGKTIRTEMFVQLKNWNMIKTLRANLDDDLVILQRMTSSPNRKNPCGNFEEWSAWKRNDVEEKVAVIKAKINDLKSKRSGTKDRRKGKRGK